MEKDSARNSKDIIYGTIIFFWALVIRISMPLLNYFKVNSAIQDQVGVGIIIVLIVLPYFVLKLLKKDKGAIFYKITENFWLFIFSIVYTFFNKPLKYGMEVWTIVFILVAIIDDVFKMYAKYVKVNQMKK